MQRIEEYFVEPKTRNFLKWNKKALLLSKDKQLSVNTVTKHLEKTHA